MMNYPPGYGAYGWPPQGPPPVVYHITPTPPPTNASRGRGSRGRGGSGNRGGFSPQNTEKMIEYLEEQTRVWKNYDIKMKDRYKSDPPKKKYPDWATGLMLAFGLGIPIMLLANLIQLQMLKDVLKVLPK